MGDKDKGIGHKAVQDVLKNMTLVDIGSGKKLSGGYYLNPNTEYYAIDGDIESGDSGSYGDYGGDLNE